LTAAVLRIGEVDPHDEPALHAWHATLVAGAAAGRTAPLIESWPAVRRSLGHPGAAQRRTAVAAYRDGEVVGAMLVELPLLEDLGTASVEIDVPPPHRGTGVGRALANWAAEHLTAAGRTVVQTEVHVPAGQTVGTWPGARFAVAAGMSCENVEDHLVLALPARARQVPPAPGYRLVSWEGPCPDDLVEAYADMWSSMSGDVPVGGLTHEAAVWDAARVRATEARIEASYRSLVTMALTDGGEPAGYTLIYLDREDAVNALQDDTFVRAGHRGHGLGLRLKVANLEQLAARAGERRWLHTSTATSNAPMQRVNAEFGFRPVERTHEYEGRLG
jgi:GNAT superfamily N-acetyltransferase